MSDCCAPETTSKPCCPAVDRTGTGPAAATGAPGGNVPEVSTELTLRDHLGMWKVRWGIGRYSYRVDPGLYAVGSPDAGSEVLVTANYRMTFDLLRSALGSLSAWILVLDTDGINVWCAAGKGTFGTKELVRRIEAVDLPSLVNHRRLILPQLGAPGVAAHEVKRQTGFSVVYGPVRASDIPAFFSAGLRTAPAMRRKTFGLWERAVLIPMELVPAAKWGTVIVAFLTVTAGALGPSDFSTDAGRALVLSSTALGLTLFAGAVASPLLLPWLPGRAYSLKGLWPGLAAAAALAALRPSAQVWSLAPWFLLIPAAASFLSLNFTGSSTYTSLSGVRREMRFAIPLQAGASALGLALWAVFLFLAPGGAL